MNPTSQAATPYRLRFDWVNVSFLAVAHLCGAGAIVYLIAVQCSPWTLAFAAAWGGFCGLSITGGNVPLAKDLQQDPLVTFQHRHYLLLALLFGALVPMAIGSIWGDPWGALLVAGFLRLCIQWHATFCINSLTHMFGSQPYSRRVSARDSFWIALLTFGEGYHNFHHRFQADYRNGVRWFHYDPTKWWIWLMARTGLARDLRRVPSERIEQARRETAALDPTPAPTR